MQSQKDQFNIPDDITYLNCAFMSPLANNVVAEGQRCAALKAQPWKVKTDDFFTIVDNAKAEFAKLVNCPKQDVALVPSVSYGTSQAARNVDPNKGKFVVVLEDQFPSNFYVWRSWCEKYNKELVVIPRNRKQNLTQLIIDKLSDEVAVAALPQVHWCDGVKLDIEEIGKVCQGHDISLVIDATQSVGAVPFNVATVKPDFLVVATYKWLMGPYSMAFSYISPKYHKEGKPLEYAWLNKQGCENFRNLCDYQEEFQEGATRFDMGQKSNFILLPMVTQALKNINSNGIENTTRYIQELTAKVAHGAEALDFGLWSENQRSENILGIELKSETQITTATKAFAKQNIIVSFRGKFLRISPNVYNTNKDIDKVLAALKVL